MMRIPLGLIRFLVILCLMSLSICSYGAAKVISGRTSHTEQRTRIVLDLTESARYQVFSLKNPTRVVVDLEQAVLGHSAKTIKPRGVVQRIRSGKQGKQGIRLVFDVKVPVRYYTFYLPPDKHSRYFRLVIDLTPISHATAQKQSVIKRSEQIKINKTEPVLPKGRDVIIAIDPGHGGKDSGAIGKNRVYEKNITLAVAKRLAALINQQPGMKAVLTRKGDYFLTLRRRTEIARAAKADLFISLLLSITLSRSFACTAADAATIPAKISGLTPFIAYTFTR